MSKVKSAERTLRFLELLAGKRNGISFTDIQTGLDIPKSSAHSLIQEFLEQNYLTFNSDTKKYYVGLEYIKLCALCAQGTELIDELSLLSNNLGKEINQTTHVGIFDNHNILYLASYTNNSRLSLMRNIGFKIPAHCTAIGKMLLSQFTNEELRALYDDFVFEKFTEKTVVDLEDLIAQVNDIRKSGYATEKCEASLYTACIALPIMQSNKMIAAFSVTFPAHEMEGMDLHEILQIMNKHKKITEQRISIV